MTRPPADEITVLPPTLNLNIYAGDDFFIDLVVTNPDGTDADLTEAKPAAQVRGRPEDDPPITEFAIDIDGNILHMHLPGEGTASLPRSAVWDCQISVPYTTTLVRGAVIVTAEVTRPDQGLIPPPDGGGEGESGDVGYRSGALLGTTQIMEDESPTGGVG